MRYTNVDINKRTIGMPAITLGTTWFGTKIDKQIALMQMDYYAEIGGKWIDTARIYGSEAFTSEERKPHFIDSEAVVGEWLNTRGARDKMIIITKGAHRSRATGDRRVNAKEINSDIETSLHNLGIDYVDIYFLHNDDENIPVSEIMPILDTLVKDGKTRGLGASNWSVARIIEANKFARDNGLTPFSISQVRWSYAIPPNTGSSAGRFDMETEPSQYKGYLELGIPIMAYSSQSKGFFIKTDKDCFDPGAIGRAVEFLSDENIRRARIVHRLAAEEGIAVSAMAFAYLWSKRIPVTALVGCQNLAQLITSLTDCDYYPSIRVMETLESEKSQ